jgi:hypothetical protein
MPVDTPVTKPVLIHVNPDDWKKFQKLVGRRMASRRIRALIAREIKRTTQR